MSVQNRIIKSCVSHVIFDMDGLLLATEELYTQAADKVAMKYARNRNEPKLVTWDLKVRQMGLQKKDLANIMVKELDLTCTPQQYLDESEKLHKTLFPEAELMGGVRRLIEHLHSSKVPIAVATSSSRQYFEIKTQKHTEMFGLFHHIVTGQSDPDVKNGKPAPDINLVCAKRFEPAALPENCLVFEDSPNGVKAALAAGMQCVMVPDPLMWSTPDFMKEAHLVLKTLNDFKPELFGLPSYS